MGTPQFRALSFWGKLQFILVHYHWHIFLAVMLTLVVGRWIWQDFLTEQPVLSVEMIDARQDSSSTEAFQSFLEQEGYSYTDSTVSLGKDFQYTELLMNKQFDPGRLLFCMVQEGNTDLYFWDSTDVGRHLAGGALADLREILPPEVLAEHQDRILYCKPLWRDVYPCAIDLSGNEWIETNNYYGDCRVGVAKDPENMELAREFLLYILQ